MTEKPMSIFPRRLRAATPRGKKYEIRDDTVTGLTLRIFPSGVRTFALQRMTRGPRQYARIGDANEMTIPEARREARRLIASFIEPVKPGNSPRTPGHPMAAFAEEFLDRQTGRWKSRTREGRSEQVTFLMS